MPVTLQRERLEATANTLGLTGAAKRVYEELVTTEISNFNLINTLHVERMKQLLLKYDTLSPEQREGYASKAQLQEKFAKLAELQQATANFIETLYSPDPVQWQTALVGMKDLYKNFIAVSSVNFPSELMSDPDLQNDLQGQRISSVFIAPAQRGARIILMAKDLIQNSKSDKYQPLLEAAKIVTDASNEGADLLARNESKNMIVNLLGKINAGAVPQEDILKITNGLRGYLLNFTTSEFQEMFNTISFSSLKPKIAASMKKSLTEQIETLENDLNVTRKRLETEEGKSRASLLIDIEKNEKILEKLQVMSGFLQNKLVNDKLNPIKVVKSKTIEPTPHSEAYGDIRIDIANEGTENRQAVKGLLRGGIPQLLQQGVNANRYHIVETKKSMMGKTASFVLKDANNVNLLQIVVMNGTVRIRELQGNTLDADSKIALMHTLAIALNVTNSQPTVTSEHIEKVRKLNELSVNDGQKIYVQKADGKKALYKQIELDSAGYTFNKVVPEIKIACENNSPDQIKKKFQAVVADGTFVPTLVYQQGIPAPMLNFTIDITSESPLVAIKQYESALNAGMTPVFSSEAKRKVDAYVKKQMDSHNQDKQIAIPTASNPQLVTGSQVLERLKQASQDGLLVSLNSTAQQALKDHVAKGAQGLEYNVPLKHPYAAVMVNQLLEMGLVPDVNALTKANKLDELRHILKEDSKLNAGRLTFVDSGNIERDLIAMQVSVEELGHPVELSPKNITEMLKHVKDKELPVFDLKNIPVKEQVACAQRLAQNGIFTKFSAEVPAGTAIFIRSRNIDHAKQMFEGYLNQGFIPVGNKRIRELSERALPIKISSTDPKVIWERMRHCAQSGLVVTLNEEQIKIMKAFSEKNNPQLPIHGYSWNTVKHNIELANQLGMGIRGVTEEAQAAYLRAQADAKGNDMPRIDIVPIHKTESRFLRSDRLVDDRNKTKDFVNNLFKAGINISTTGLSVMKADIQNQATKTKWFGWSKTPTAKAEEADRFLRTEFAHIEATVKSLASKFNKTPAENLRAVADDLAPPRVKKVKQPVAQPVIQAVSPAPGVVKVPAPLPVTRPLPYLAAGHASVAEGAPASVQPALTIQSALHQIAEFQKDLQGRLDIGDIKPKEFVQISDQLYSVSSFLRQAEKDLAQGKVSAASNLPQYLESIKSKPEAHAAVKTFLTKLVEPQQVQPQSAPRSRI